MLGCRVPVPAALACAMPCNGNYTMDRICILTGVDGIGDIPLKVLFKKAPGDLVCLGEIDAKIVSDDSKILKLKSLFDVVLEIIPKDQTGFDMLFAKPATILEVDEAIPRLSDLGLNLTMKSVAMAVKITEIGINKGTYMRLRWLAAEGPQPAHANIPEKKRDMQLTYDILLVLINKRVKVFDLSKETHTALRVDLGPCLSYWCWNDVHGWQH